MVSEVKTGEDVRHWDDVNYTVNMSALHEACVEFKVYQIVAWGTEEPPSIRYYRCKDEGVGLDMVESLAEAEVFMSGAIRFDGCMNFQFDAQESCMLHLCGVGDIEHLATMMTRLYEWAAEFMPDNKDLILG